MLQTVSVAMTSLLLAMLMPAVLLTNQARETEMIVVIEEEESYDEEVILVKHEDGIKELPIEEYLLGVVLTEMPPTFHEEALKAQVVAARTFTLRSLDNGKHVDFDLCSDSSCCQAWRDRYANMIKFADHWQEYCDRVMAAIRQTKGEVLTYDGELIEAVYFSCSGGSTEAAVAVWGSDVPYLQSVESKGEEISNKYHSEVTVSADDFKSRILQQNQDAVLGEKTQTWFGDMVISPGGGVEEMVIGGVAFRGTQIRSLFGLNSTKFTIKAEDENIIFSVYGYGHRVGMSQYGAQAMAEDGRDYREILQHYYQGTKIERQ